MTKTGWVNFGILTCVMSLFYYQRDYAALIAFPIIFMINLMLEFYEI